eukprot:scaffold9095_cov125-Isochrysis_galbana.AAC.2
MARGAGACEEPIWLACHFEFRQRRVGAARLAYPHPSVRRDLLSRRRFNCGVRASCCRAVGATVVST